VGSNPTLSATSFIFLYLQSVVSIVVSAWHCFPANDGSKFYKFRPKGITYLQTTLNTVFGHLVVNPRIR
jgi:hypothetical protein